jgi:hypothetical protein
VIFGDKKSGSNSEGKKQQKWSVNQWKMTMYCDSSDSSDGQNSARMLVGGG